MNADQTEGQSPKGGKVKAKEGQHSAGAGEGEKHPETPREFVLDAFKKGCSRKAAAAAGDMTAAELDRQLADDPDLARKARMGRGKAEYELVTAIWNGDWRAKAWLLEHWLAPGAQAEGEGFDDDERERDDLSYRRLREDLARSSGCAEGEDPAPEGTAGGRGDVAGPAVAAPA
jgi:hypothetical protein